MSLDGYIAKPNDDLQWLNRFEATDEDYGYAEYYSSIDAIIMGSRSYQIIKHLGEWPYKDKPCYVMSHQLKSLDSPHTHLISGNIAAVIAKLKSANYRKIWLLGGGKLVAAFHQADMIDEYIISIIPVILGNGIPLFPTPLNEKPLKLVEAKSYSTGVVQLQYTKAK